MADSDNSTSKVKKRSLRSSAPDTMRSQSQRSGADKKAAKAATPNSFRYGFLWPARLVGKGLRWIGHLWPVRMLGKILFPAYFRNSWRELKLVTWPGRRESLRLTGAVLIFAIVFGAIVAGVDYGLDKLFKEFILK